MALAGLTPAAPEGSSAAGGSYSSAAAAGQGGVGVRCERMDSLAGEVLVDVERAAALWARAHGMT